MANEQNKEFTYVMITLDCLSNFLHEQKLRIAIIYQTIVRNFPQIVAGKL
jgi:hypothetical protein